MIYILFLYEAQRQSGKEGFSFIPQFKRDNDNTDSKDSLDNDSVISGDIAPLFVGDSRIVGMANALKDQVPYFDYHAISGSGLYYFKTLEDRILSSGADCLIIGFGVNDLNDINEYIDIANNLGEQLSMPVYYLTVNPVDEEKARKNGYYVKDKNISSFNKNLFENAENYTVIDTYSYLTDTGFDTSDGIHYRDKTYIDIYRFIMNFLELHS